jgi:hypothetical protein
MCEFKVTTPMWPAEGLGHHGNEFGKHKLACREPGACFQSMWCTQFGLEKAWALAYSGLQPQFGLKKAWGMMAMNVVHPLWLGECMGNLHMKGCIPNLA